ncbi:MAG: hypothetical protein ACM31L_05260 [Actinomycetota bacterium]
MIRAVLAALALLSLAACWQVDADVVPADAVTRPEGVKDGVYRRADGTELAVRWNEAERAFDIGGSAVGKARVAKAGANLYLVQFTGNMRLALLAARDGDDLALLSPAPAAQARLATRHGVSLRPGPIDQLVGSPAAVRAYLTEASTLPAAELTRSGKLAWSGPVPANPDRH